MAHWVEPPGHTWVPKRAPRLTTAVVIALLVGAVIVTFTLVRQKAQTDSLADPILTLCAEGGETGDRLTGAGLCGKAAAAKVDPVSTQPVELSPEQTDQVQALVKAEIAKRPAPKSEPPTAAQLSAVVQALIAANPTMFKPPAPTAAQLQSAADKAVAQYLRAHPVDPPVIQQIPQPIPQYDMPGLGGFTGAPGGVWQQPWPRQGPRQPR